MKGTRESIAALSRYHELFYGHVLRPYQQQWIDDWLSSKYSLTLGSRQIGKTFALGWLSVLLAKGYKTSQGLCAGEDVLIISASMKKAKNIVKAINAHLDSMERVVGPQRTPNRGGLQEVVLTSGKTIQAVAGRAAGLQGFTGHVLVDEFSITESDPDELLSQALAVSSSRPELKVCILTNADREGSYLHQFLHAEEFASRRESWTLRNTTIYDAHPVLPPHLLQLKQALSAAAWRKYYENVFLPGGDSRFIESHLLEAQTTEVEVKGGRTLVSIDPAFSKKGNPTGYCVAHVGDGKCMVLESGHLFGPTEEELLSEIDRMMREHGASWLLFDVGTAIVTRQKLERKYGRRFKPVSVSQNKMTNWCAAIEDGLLSKTLGIGTDPALLEDLQSIGYSKSGAIVVPERKARFGEYKIHADAALALMYIMDHVGQKRSMRELRIVDVADVSPRKDHFRV